MTIMSWLDLIVQNVHAGLLPSESGASYARQNRSTGCALKLAMCKGAPAATGTPLLIDPMDAGKRGRDHF